MPITLNYTGLRITDAIAGNLSASAAAYAAAADGVLVPITKGEYDAVFAALDTPTKAMATDAMYDSALTGNGGVYGLWTNVSNVPSAATPNFVAGHYPVLVRATSGAALTKTSISAIAGAASANGTAVLLGTPTSITTTAAVNETVYYVVKNQTKQATAGNLVPRLNVPVAAWHSPGGSYYSTEGAAITSTLPTAFAYYPKVQIITTPTKSW